MQQLKTLIRLHKMEVDDRRRVLAEFQAVEDRLTAERRALEAEVAAETQVAGTSLMNAMTWGAYLKQVKLRRANLDRAILQAKADVARAEDAVAEAFQELKRYELAQEDRERQAKEEAKRRETQKFDEIGSQRFHKARE